MTTEVRSGLVIVAHPDPTSFNHALATRVRDEWQGLGIRTDLIDLHAIGFDPSLSVEEARGLRSSDPSVREQIALLLGADVLAVVHPNCWGAPPAMMKGWMDRVFAPEAAYSFPKGEDDGDAPAGLLQGKRALVLNTSNTTLQREMEAFGDPLDRIWRDCLLRYCGFEAVQRRVFRVLATSSPAERAGWIEEATSAARSLVSGGLD